MNREKNYRIELARAIACVMVIGIHTSNYYSRAYGEISNGDYIFSIIINGICRVSVPLFFMISGYLLIPEVLLIRKSVKRAWNTFCVLALWSGIYYVWNWLYCGEGYNFMKLFQSPIKKHLWFLYAILGMYVILPFIQCMMKHMPDLLMRYFAFLWFGFLTLDYIIALYDMKITYEIPLVGDSCYLGYFIMGYIISHTMKKTAIPRWLCYTGAVICIAVTVVATYYGSNRLGIHNEDYFEYRNVLIAAASCLIFYDITSIAPGVLAQAGIMRERTSSQLRDRARNCMQFIAKHSFTIYLCHVLFLDIMKNMFTPAQVPAWIGIPVGTVALLVVSLLFAVIWDQVAGFIIK